MLRKKPLQADSKRGPIPELPPSSPLPESAGGFCPPLKSNLCHAASCPQAPAPLQPPCQSPPPSLTRVVLHQLVQALEGDAGRDVDAAIVHVADLIVLDDLPLDLVKVPQREREGAWKQRRDSAGGPVSLPPWGPPERALPSPTFPRPLSLQGCLRRCLVAP